MAVKAVPAWAQLPPQAPEAHRLAWERAWDRANSWGKAGEAGSISLNARISAMLTALVEDPEAPTALVAHAASAHLTEGRGAPDGPGPRARLLVACLRRDVWRTAWLPASLAALQESEHDLPRDLRIELTTALLSRGRVPAELRPLVAAVAVLGRPGRASLDYTGLLVPVARAPDVDDEVRARLGQLLGKPGWLIVRRDSLRDHPDLDEATRASLRRCRDLKLSIPAACALAVAELTTDGLPGAARPRPLDSARGPRRPPTLAERG